MLLIPETLQLSPRHYHGVVASFEASLEDDSSFLGRRRHQPLQREPQSWLPLGWIPRHRSCLGSLKYVSCSCSCLVMERQTSVPLSYHLEFRQILLPCELPRAPWCELPRDLHLVDPWCTAPHHPHLRHVGDIHDDRPSDDECRVAASTRPN